jgi:hypothetical protein
MRIWLTICILISFVEVGLCDIKIGSETTIKFASVDEGQKILTTRDNYIERMSAFDRAARMKTDAQISQRVFLNFVATNVLNWSNDEKALVSSAISSIQPKLNALSLPFPKIIFLIKTTGNEEGGQQYTRANAIVLNHDALAAGHEKELQDCVAHELFHILSRQNPGLREKLYAGIGFHPCKEITLPSRLKPVKVTNPDAPRNDHYISVQVKDKTVEAIPILFSKLPKYDVNQGGEFFHYLQFKFLIVEKANDQTLPTMTFDDSNPQLVDTNEIHNFFEQIGRNTQYIIHPEEILADNFSLLVRGKTVPSPQILKMMEDVIRARP